MSPRILIIEDNPANLELMRYLLEAFGYSIMVATNGEDGIALARREHPDLVICDVQLPGMSGSDVARAVKLDPRLKRVPLVAVTAFAMLGDRDRLLLAGFDGYISKPIDPETFNKQIVAFLPSRGATSGTRSVSASTASLEKMPRNGLTILAVDNLQSNLDFASSMLEHMGYTVATAGSVEEALRVARHVVPDLIMSDVCMPGSGGYDLIAEVKRDPRLRSVPFMFITSTALDTADRQKGLDLGAAKYLIRPIEPQQLLAEIEACLKAAVSP